MLYKLAQQAKHYFAEDPNTAPIKLRQFGEVLARQLAALTNTSLQPNASQVEIINELPNSNTTIVKQIKLPLPRLKELELIVTRAEGALVSSKATGERVSQVFAKAHQLDQSILAKAFHGEHVPQAPNDEPASALLERIRRDSAETHRPKSTKRAKA